MYTVKCECVKGKSRLGKVIEQRIVVLHEGLDDRYVVGECSKCGKRHVKKLRV